MVASKRKALLCGFAFLVLGASANAQEMICNYDGNYPWTQTNKPYPGDCVNLFQTTTWKQMLGLKKAPPFCSPFFDTSVPMSWFKNGTNNSEPWSLTANAFLGSDANGNPQCQSTSRAYTVGTTVDSFTSAPAQVNWIASASQSPIAGTIPLDGTPVIVGSANIGSDWGSVNYSASQYFVPQSSFTTYTIVYNDAILAGDSNGGYYDTSTNTIKVTDWTGKDVSPTWSNPLSVWTDVTAGCNSCAATQQYMGIVSGLTDGQLYTIEVTGTAYAGGTNNHGSFAIGTLSVLAH